MGKVLFSFLNERLGPHVIPLHFSGYLIFTLMGLIFLVLCLAIELRAMRLSSLYLLALLLSLIGGLAGARLLPILQHLLASGHIRWSTVLKGGNVFYGGLIGTYVSLFIFLRLLALPYFPFIDRVSLYLPLAHASGRTGCFLAGCCFGKITDSGVGIAYPSSTPAFTQQVRQHVISADALKSLPVFPVQIYESIVNVIIFLLLLSLARKNKTRPGLITSAYVFFYATGRFFLEFLRGDSIRGVYYGFSTSQIISVMLVVTSVTLYYHRTELENIKS